MQLTKGKFAGRPVSRVLSRAERGDGHFSSPPVARRIKRAYPGVVTDRTGPAPLFGLAPGGVCRASRSPGCWWALTYLAPAFHPYPARGERSGVRGEQARSECFPIPHSPLIPDPSPLAGRYAFCCTFPVLHLRRLRPRRLRTVGVTHHRVLWSPDFPLPGPPPKRRYPGNDRPADPRTIAIIAEALGRVACAAKAPFVSVARVRAWPAS